MSGGSSSRKASGAGRGKGGRKGPPIVWEGSLGPDFFSEAVYEFLVESKSDFSKDSPLRGYDSRKEDWPKCRHGEDCLVHMCAEGVDGGRRFFKCPRAWVIVTTISLFNIFLFCTTYERFVAVFQCSRKLWVH